MTIEKDDLHSHRTLGADLKKEAAKLALFDPLVDAVEKLHGALCMKVTSKNDPAVVVLREYAHLLNRAWDLQK